MVLGSRMIVLAHGNARFGRNSRAFFVHHWGISLKKGVLPQRSNPARASRTNVYLS